MSEEYGIYKENILDHYKNPRNFGNLEKFSFKHKELNPICGDVIEIYVLIEDNKVKEIRFDGQGCAVSMAASSMLTEKVKGMKIEDVKKLNEKDIFEMLGVKLDASRIKCGTLALKALLRVVKNE